MKKEEIEVGGVYAARIGRSVVKVKVDRIYKRDARGYGQDRTCYDVTNLRTGRQTTFTAASRFRGRAVQDDPFPKSVRDERPKGTYSCCRQPVGQSHADDCPMFPKLQEPRDLPARDASETAPRFKIRVALRVGERLLREFIKGDDLGTVTTFTADEALAFIKMQLGRQELVSVEVGPA